MKSATRVKKMRSGRHFFYDFEYILDSIIYDLRRSFRVAKAVFVIYVRSLDVGIETYLFCINT